MSMVMEEEIKRWTTKGKSALVVKTPQGKTTVAEASRAYELPPLDIEGWIEDGRRGMENALRANPLDVQEQRAKQIFQIHGRQVRKRPAGFQPQIEAKFCITEQPNKY